MSTQLKPGQLIGSLQDEVIKRLQRWAAHGKLPSNLPHRRNIAIAYNKKDLIVRFTFVTRENMRIDYDVDLRELHKRGQEYLDDGYHKLQMAIEDFAKARQEEQMPIFVPNASASHVAAAIGNAVRTVH